MLKSKSKIYFYILAPTFLIFSAVMSFFVFKGYQSLLILIGFLFVNYLAILGWRLWIDRPGQKAESFKLEKMSGKISKDIRDIALKEHDYIRETMAQAMNDRHTMINYFLLTTGVFAAAIGLILSEEGWKNFEHKVEVIIALSMIFSSIAWLHLLMVIRLRQAWCESTIAMNRIKQFFLLSRSISDDDYRSPFYWRSATTPKAAKLGNLYHLAALLIGFISSVAITLISVILLRNVPIIDQAWIDLSFFAYHYLLLISVYNVFLEEGDASF